MKFTAGTSFKFTVVGTVKKNTFWLQTRGTLVLGEDSTLTEIKNDLIDRASTEFFLAADNTPFPMEQIRIKELKPLA